MTGNVQVRPSELAQQDDLFRQRFAPACLWGGELLLGRVVAAIGCARLGSRPGDYSQGPSVLDLRRGDPHGEPDLGAVEVGPMGRPTRVLGKLDLHDETFARASPNPACPRRTRRVLTLMLASEY